jgi:hypothetical protein
MSTAAQDERLDVLLALALTFGHVEGGEGAGQDPLAALGAVGEADRRAAASRLARYEALTAERRQSWLKRRLVAAHGDERQLRLDPQIDPTHVVEALRAEPPRVRSLIMLGLPERLREAAARALNVPRPAPDPRAKAARDRTHPRVLEVVRRSVFRHFVSASQLREPTHFDLLPRAALARLIRLLGVRELALAFRGMSQIANIEPLWRRLPPEDYRVFADQMTSLEEIAPRRVAYAEEVVGEAFNFDPDPVAVPDHTGLRLLALALRSREQASIDYTAQKLPVGVADYLRELLSRPVSGGDAAMANALAAEVEQLAAFLSGPPPRGGSGR